MQKHIQVYLEFYWEDINELQCEVCWAPVKDIHHIKFRSSFWKKTKHLQDIIENLIGLCRSCHDRAHFKKEPYLSKDQLTEIHLEGMKHY